MNTVGRCSFHKDRTAVCSYPTQAACCSHSTQHQEAAGSSSSHSRISEPLCAGSRNADKPGKWRRHKKLDEPEILKCPNLQQKPAAGRRQRTVLSVQKDSSQYWSVMMQKVFTFHSLSLPLRTVLSSVRNFSHFHYGSNISVKQTSRAKSNCLHK